MIDKATIFLNQQINDYLKLILDQYTITDKITLTNVVDQEGKIAIQPDSLGLTVINIEEEFAIQQNRRFVKTGESELGAINPSLHLNLYILISANFGNYREALKFLSLVIQFFQIKNTFRKDNTPELEALGIDKLDTKLFKGSFELQNQLWGTLGAKYMPSVIYKLGIVQFQNEQINNKVPLVKSINTNMTKRVK